MSTTLAGVQFKDGYKDLLQMGNSGAGVTASLLPVAAGDGTATGLSLSTTEVSASGGTLSVTNSTSKLFKANSNGIQTVSGGAIGWVASATDIGAGSNDTGFTRLAAGVIGTTSWLQNTGGTVRMATSPTNATNTLAPLTALTVTLKAGRKYVGELVLFANNSTAAEGLQFSFDGGAATITSFEAAFAALPPGASLALGTLSTTALATPLTATTATTADACYTIKFGLVCNAAGTFIPQFAENSTHSAGTATVKLNSYMIIRDSAN